MAINSYTNTYIQIKKPKPRENILIRQPQYLPTRSDTQYTGKMGPDKVKHDYYAILGLRKKRQSTEKEINQAFRRLALVHHPDKSKSQSSKDKYHLVSEAYLTLSDETTRRIYDVQHELHFSCRSRTKSSPHSSSKASELTPAEIETELAYTRSKIEEICKKVRVMEKAVENLDRMRRVAGRFREKTLEQVAVDIKALRENIRKMWDIRTAFEERQDELLDCDVLEEDMDVGY